MSTVQFENPPGIQVFNDGSCIRIEKNGKTLLILKEQVKTIDTVHDNIIRIDIGEGQLKNIFLNYPEVTNPIVDSASDLRDLIKAMLQSDKLSGGNAKEETQLTILGRLETVCQELTSIRFLEEDPEKILPTIVDESNPNLIYKGWHGQSGDPAAHEWAILRIRNVDNVIIYDWAYGMKTKASVWNDRENTNYFPVNYVVLQPQQ